MSLRSVLVTGANRGLGLEFIKQFVALPTPPIHVFAICRDPDKAPELQEIAKANTNVCVLKLDMKDYKSYPNIVQKVGDSVGDAGINLLINNAGVLYSDKLDNVTRDNMIDNFEVNAVTPLMFTKAMLPLLKKAAVKSGNSALSGSRAAVVNVTSKMGSMDDNTSGGSYSYRTSKAAINMVTKSLSVDLKPQGILAFVVHPGWVLTDMGGSNALITPQTSVQGMINTITKATSEQAGQFLNYDGKPISW